MATQMLLDNQQLKKIMDEYYLTKKQAELEQEQIQKAKQAYDITEKYGHPLGRNNYAWPKDSEEMRNLLREIEILKQAETPKPKKEPTLQDIIDAEVKNLKR